MGLAAGVRLGPYEILAPLGVGGMGEVYRARDTRLERKVAIKILPESFSSDPDRLRRFQQEARAIAALNHPNILAIYDTGTEKGVHYLVSELLEGEPLRARIGDSGLGTRRATDYALQVANGLAAAHEKGIVHRDLKPENIYITREGRVKILDFGLAKQKTPAAAPWGAEATVGDTMTSAPPGTAVGMVVGTVGYMAPEQVRGLAADHRSDIFAFGAVLYEMLSGRRAFRGDTAIETMTAILKEDPPELAQTGSRISPALDRIARRCLEKEPDQRLQSAKDLAFALEALSGTSEGAPAIPQVSRTSRWMWIAAGVLVLAASTFTFFARPLRGFSVPTTIRQVTFRDGYIRMARFAPDGQSIVYGAMWDGRPMQLFSGRINSAEARAIEPDNADLLAVSRTGELAVALNRQFVEPWCPVGTLARVPLLGGMPREMAGGALDADWAPDESGLAYTTRTHGRFQLRLFPAGKVLYDTAGYISHIRFSPDGKLIAFMDHPIYGDDRGTVAVVDMQGNRKTLTPEYATEQGLAWSSDGHEVWYTANSEWNWSLWATTLDGKRRVVTRDVAKLELQDISREGRVLVTSKVNTNDIIPGNVAGVEGKNLVTYQWGSAAALSADGQKAAIAEFNAPGPVRDYALYIRKVDGSAATALGPGYAFDFSPDGKTVLAMLPSQNDKLLLVPTGVGETKTLPSFGLHYQDGLFLPDGKRFVAVAAEGSKGTRIYVQSVDGNAGPRPITPEGAALGMVVSPDGKWVIAMVAGSDNSGEGADNSVKMYPIDSGGEPRVVKGIAPDEKPVQWLDDGKLLVVGQTAIPLVVFKLDPATGKREPWRRFIPANPAGVITFSRVFVTRDAKRYLYDARRVLSNLYVIEGLK